MFKVLLVVPRFLLLHLKFFLHDHVSEHLLGSDQSHSLRRVPLFKHDKSFTDKRFGPRPLSARLQPAPVCAPLRSRQTDGQTDSSLLTKLCCLQDMPPVWNFRIKAALVTMLQPASLGQEG